MNYELKTMVNKTYELCDTIQGIGNWNHDINIRDILKMDLLQMAMYLSASDGTIAYQEAKVMADYLDMPIDPANINKWIREHNIYSTEFENTVPVSVQIFVAADNKLDEAGVDVDEYSSELLLKLFKGIAQVLVTSDGNIDPQEEEDWRIYSQTLDGYLTENLNSRKRGVQTGFSKNSGVSAPRKGGSVSAPRKG